jgi:hypothetical protein
MASLPHGGEISRLAVYVAGPVELRNLCEADVEGCYEEGTEPWIIIPGEPIYEYGSSVEEIVAHEYGHHLSASRPGGAFGTPRWDVYLRVCELSHQGALVPGNESARYGENPEEAFAESYAALTFPEIVTTWQERGWSPLLRPTPEGLARIRLDIEDPWAPRYAEKRLKRSCAGGRNLYW